jgi:hypothetical protein
MIYSGNGMWDQAYTSALTHGIYSGSGTPHTVTAASWTSGVATLTIGSHTITAGNAIQVNSVSPAGYNMTVQVTGVTGTTVSFPLASNPGIYTSGGGVVAVTYPEAIDGGLEAGQTYDYGFFGIAAAQFYFEPASAYLAGIVQYIVQNIEKPYGVNWYWDESVPGSNGGNAYTDDGGLVLYNSSLIYPSGATIGAAADLSTMRDKLQNDIDNSDTSVCTKAHNDPSEAGHTFALTAGGSTAQGGASVYITLAAADHNSTTNYYLNNIVVLPSLSEYAIATGYTPSSNQVSVAAWLPIAIGGSANPPASGTPYVIYATYTLSSSSPGGVASVVGYNTNFLSGWNVGDAIGGGYFGQYGSTPDNFNLYFATASSKVTVITDATHMTVTNGGVVNLGWPGSVFNSSTPVQVWHMPAWQAGDCSFIWQNKHDIGYVGSSPILYPTNGGVASNYLQDPSLAASPQTGSNYSPSLMNSELTFDLAIAGLSGDARAIRDASLMQTALMNVTAQHLMNYGLAFSHYGTSYGGYVAGTIPLIPAVLQASVPSYPSLDTANANGWLASTPQYTMFTLLPDIANGLMWKMQWGGFNAYGDYYDWKSVEGTGSLMDSVFFENPTSPYAGWLRHFLENVTNPTRSGSYWGYNGVLDGYNVIDLLHNDPKIASVDYTTGAGRFDGSSPATCSSLVGWECPSNMRGDAVISRGGDGWVSKTNSLLFCDHRTFWDDRDHYSNGQCLIYDVGNLLGTDYPASGAGLPSNYGWDNTITGGSLQVGGSEIAYRPGMWGAYNTTNYESTNAAVSPIGIWYQSNHGAWDPRYGDQSNTVVAWCSDESGQFLATTGVTTARRCLVHMKPASGEEIIVQGDVVALSTSNTVAIHFHYPQVGLSASGTIPYNEGSTSYSGGQVTELEDGCGGTNPACPDSNAQRNFGLLTKFFPATTATVTADGTSYSGSQGYAYRMSVCGGGTACGSPAPVTAFNNLTVHKITKTATGVGADTTLTASAISGLGSNWMGVNTADKVALTYLGATGSYPASFPPFNTTCSLSGTCQYVIQGIAAGMYHVYVSSAEVTGSPFTVANGDNHIVFTAAGGSVSLSTSTACSITTTTLPNGTVGVSYSQTINTVNCVSPVTWSISAGSLCSGRSLGSSTGIISGTATVAQTCSFTVQAVDSLSSTGTQPLSITINAAGAATSINGKTSITGTVPVIH